MKTTVIAAVLLALGIGAGFVLGSSGPAAGRGEHPETRELVELRETKITDEDLIRQLRAEIAELQRRLAAIPTEESPYTDNTPELVEKLLQDAYAETNVDWFLEAIDRLLCMGEKGYPLLRKLIMDVAFGAKFLPTESDFRIEQLYKLGRIFANRERQFIGFLNYLLTEKDTNYWLRQGAMMGGAFYVGSKAPGTEQLQQTMMQFFLESAGMGSAPLVGLMPGGANMQKRMQVFAIMMTGNKEMIPQLHEEYRKTKDKDFQADIVNALAYMGDESALPMIQERLDPTQGDFTKEIGALGRLNTEASHTAATAFLRQIPDSRRFYQHARTYVRQGGGAPAILLIRERIQADPKDPEVATTIGSLRRYPTQESLDTLNMIAAASPDQEIQRRAKDAAGEVDRRLRGEPPEEK